MLITKKQLKQIIKEELGHVINEAIKPEVLQNSWVKDYAIAMNPSALPGQRGDAINRMMALERMTQRRRYPYHMTFQGTEFDHAWADLEVQLKKDFPEGRSWDFGKSDTAAHRASWRQALDVEPGPRTMGDRWRRFQANLFSEPTGHRGYDRPGPGGLDDPLFDLTPAGEPTPGMNPRAEMRAADADFPESHRMRSRRTSIPDVFNIRQHRASRARFDGYHEGGPHNIDWRLGADIKKAEARLAKLEPETPAPKPRQITATPRPELPHKKPGPIAQKPGPLKAPPGKFVARGLGPLSVVQDVADIARGEEGAYYQLGAAAKEAAKDIGRRVTPDWLEPEWLKAEPKPEGSPEHRRGQPLEYGEDYI